MSTPVGTSWWGLVWGGGTYLYGLIHICILHRNLSILSGHTSRDNIVVGSSELPAPSVPNFPAKPGHWPGQTGPHVWGFGGGGGVVLPYPEPPPSPPTTHERGRTATDMRRGVRARAEAQGHGGARGTTLLRREISGRSGAAAPTSTASCTLMVLSLRTSDGHPTAWTPTSPRMYSLTDRAAGGGRARGQGQGSGGREGGQRGGGGLTLLLDKCSCKGFGKRHFVGMYRWWLLEGLW